MHCCDGPKPLNVTIGAVTRLEKKLTERLGVRTNSKMDSVIDKDQRLSEGPVVDDDRKLDFEELSGDEEVTIHLPRKGADERDPLGVEIRDVPGVPVTQREDWFNVEPLQGARPKWNRVGRPTPVNEETIGLEAEATGGRDVLDAEEREAPAPQLPPPRRDMQGWG